jgi:hypothetical protein
MFWLCVWISCLYVGLGYYLAVSSGIISYPAVIMALYFAFLAYVHRRRPTDSP